MEAPQRHGPHLADERAPLARKPIALEFSSLLFEFRDGVLDAWEAGTQDYGTGLGVGWLQGLLTRVV